VEGAVAVADVADSIPIPTTVDKAQEANLPEAIEGLHLLLTLNTHPLKFPTRISPKRDLHLNQVTSKEEENLALSDLNRALVVEVALGEEEEGAGAVDVAVTEEGVEVEV